MAWMSFISGGEAPRVNIGPDIRWSRIRWRKSVLLELAKSSFVPAERIHSLPKESSHVSRVKKVARCRVQDSLVKRRLVYACAAHVRLKASTFEDLLIMTLLVILKGLLLSA
jgi:hypothetical protein